MRTMLKTGVAALVGAAMLGSVAVPAQADPHGWRGDYGWRGDNDWGVGVGAGLAGLALGAALAHPYYGPSYGYGYGDDYGQCVGTRRVWDPYVGAYVVRRFYYAC